jgi:hypothetical protein
LAWLVGFVAAGVEGRDVEDGFFVDWLADPPTATNSSIKTTRDCFFIDPSGSLAILRMFS